MNRKRLRRALKLKHNLASQGGQGTTVKTIPRIAMLVFIVLWKGAGDLTMYCKTMKGNRTVFVDHDSSATLEL